jgi:ATP-dependent DNA helicase RecG
LPTSLNYPFIPRNPLIVHIFYLGGLIEEVGSGIGRIIESLRLHGLPEPEFKEEMGGFSVRFYKDIYTEENLRIMGLNQRQIKAILYVKEMGIIKNMDYQRLTGVSRQMATIELTSLVKKGILVKIGKAGAAVAYTLPNK